MVDHILEQRVTTKHCEVGTPFSNPLTEGAEKAAGGIIEKHINKTIKSEANTEDGPNNDEIDLLCELHSIYYTLY